MSPPRCVYKICVRSLVVSCFKTQARVVQRLDNTIHRINHYPADSVGCFVNIYPLDSDLSGGYRYPAFEQLGPGCLEISLVDFTSPVNHCLCLSGKRLLICTIME